MIVRRLQVCSPHASGIGGFTPAQWHSSVGPQGCQARQLVQPNLVKEVGLMLDTLETPAFCGYILGVHGRHDSKPEIIRCAYQRRLIRNSGCHELGEQVQSVRVNQSIIFDYSGLRLIEGHQLCIIDGMFACFEGG